MATGFNVRVGDADREAVAAQLREHYADGRLTLEELNERLDEAFAAKTRADLNTVMRDLPHAVRSAADAPFAGQAPGWPSEAFGQPGAGPVQPSGARRAGGDQGDGGWAGQRGARGPFAVFAPLMGLMSLLMILGGVFLFGLGGGERPLAIVLFIAAFALLRRLFGLGRRRGYGGPRGPRGPRGRRCR